MSGRRHKAGFAAIVAAGFACSAGGAGAGPASHGAGEQAFPAGAILFRSGRLLEGPTRLHATDAGGASLRDLGIEAGTGVRWSPDGRRIAFSRLEGDDWADVYVQRADATGRTRIARSGNRPAVFQGQLSWAPDGRRIAFTAPVRAGSLFSAIWTVGVDGRGRRRLTTPAGASDVRPVWSPDGRRIAFLRQLEPCRRSICAAVYLVRSDGRGLRRLPTGSGDAVIGRPSWSPGGKRLAFGLCCQGGAFVVNADGTARHAIARRATVYPFWSPNGRWIALVGDGTHVVRPNGTGYRRISERGLFTASWAPDSSALAIDDRCCAPDIWVVAADGSGERRLTEGWRYGYGNEEPQWNPRGLPAERLAGTVVSPALPSDSHAEGALLRTTQTVQRLSADGWRVALAYSDNKVEAWDVPSGRITRFPFSFVTGNNAFGSRGFAMTGEHVAMTRFSSGAGIDSWALSRGSLDVPKPVEFQLGSLSWPDLCCSIPLEHLEGDGPLLVVDSWGPCRISQSPPCSRGPKFGGRLHRVDENQVTQIAVDPGPLNLLSVDGDRILVDRENGALQLFRADGTPLFAITYGPATLLGAQLDGDDIAVLTTEGLSAHDARTGDLRHHRRLDAPNARLVDVANGIAVYLAGDEIHLHRLSDGREGVIRPAGRGPVLAELEEPGLFYSYAVEDGVSRGRVAFIPFDRLPAST